MTASSLGCVPAECHAGGDDLQHPEIWDAFSSLLSRSCAKIEYVKSCKPSDFTQRFDPGLPSSRQFGWSDLAVLLAVVSLLYLGVRLAFDAPTAVQGPEIALTPAALPWYASLSLGPISAAYVLSFLFTIVY